MKKFKVTKTDVSVAIIENDDGEILLEKKSFDYPWFNDWCLFGGKIEPKEKPRDALIRELKEELFYFEPLTKKKNETRYKRIRYWNKPKIFKIINKFGKDRYKDEISGKIRIGNRHIFLCRFKITRKTLIATNEGAGHSLFARGELEKRPVIKIVNHNLKVIKKYLRDSKSLNR